MKNNAFNALLGTELPVIQAPMAGVQDSQMAIAVSNVGGLGSLPCGMLNKDAIVKELQLIQQATNRPFNLNFFCHEMPKYDANKHEEWQKRCNRILLKLVQPYRLSQTLRQGCLSIMILLTRLNHLHRQ